MYEPAKLFDELATGDLEAMVEAGQAIVDCHRQLAETGDSIVGELLKPYEKFFEWNHYPEGDVQDPNTHAQYYYHAHPGAQRMDEHGHFHTFLRPLGMPSEIRPAPLPDFESPAGPNDALSHIVAISMDRSGLPVRLFTTNRWVTGEVWYGAADVTKLIGRFAVDLARPPRPVDRWITNMLTLYRAQISELLRARDAAIAAWAQAHPDRNVYEDRELQVTSMADIEVGAQLNAVQDALQRRSSAKS